MGDTVTWLSSSFMDCSTCYDNMVHLLSDNLEVAKICIMSMTSGEIDEYSASLVDIFARSGRILPLFQLLLGEESVSVHNCSVDGKTAASKFCTAYSRLIGNEYLQVLLSDLLTEFISNQDLELEIQPKILAADLYSEDDPRILERLEVNQKHLQEATTIFINRIIDPDMIAHLPVELLEIIQFVEPERRAALVSDFLIYKMISPAIVTPEAYQLLPPDLLPSRNARRNLVLLTNILRNCVSGKPCGRDNYMSCMNSFITKMHPTLKTHAEKIVSLPFKKTRTGSCVSLDPFVIFNFDFSSLLDLHLLLDQSKLKISSLSDSSKSLTTEEKHHVKQFLSSLPPAPCVGTSVGKKVPPWRAPRRARSVSTDPVDNITEISKVGEESTIDILGAETACLDRAGFLYLGPNSREGFPVVYLIANRFKREFLDNVDLLITYAYQITSLLGDSRYMVVIDMSWAKISDEMKESVYKQVNKLFSVLERRVRKNLARVFIVHPSAYTRAVTLFLRQFTSSKLKSKITEVYNWESLQSDINKEDIALPDTSKDYITKTFSTIKVNSKGKNQKRLIKFTTDSLLNIDPRTKRVQNEKKLSQFEKIEVPVDSNELLIYFNNQNPSSGRGRFVKGSSSDKLQRKYIFESAKDRDDVILDIYRTSFFAPSFEFPQEYRVVKVNKRGRHQDRILKLTCDSLLNLDSTTIKSEISFAGIDSVQEDEKPNVIWLQFKAETKRRKIICKDSTNLLGALREGLDRYRAGGELPEQPNYSDNEIFGEE